MKLCPECGEPPHYHSFCTRCARLFWKSERKWAKRAARRERMGAFIEAFRSSSSAIELAAKVGKSVTQVHYWRVELGLPAFAPGARKPLANAWSASEDERLAKAVATGMTEVEAVAFIGRTRGAVKNRRSHLQLPPFKRPVRPKRKAWPPARIKMLNALRQQRLTFSQCAKRLGTTRNAIAHGTRYLKETAHP